MIGAPAPAAELARVLESFNAHKHILDSVWPEVDAGEVHRAAYDVWSDHVDTLDWNEPIFYDYDDLSGLRDRWLRQHPEACILK